MATQASSTSAKIRSISSGPWSGHFDHWRPHEIGADLAHAWCDDSLSDDQRCSFQKLRLGHSEHRRLVAVRRR